MEIDSSTAKLEAMKALLAMAKDGITTLEGVSMVLDAYVYKLKIASASEKIEQLCKECQHKTKK